MHVGEKIDGIVSHSMDTTLSETLELIHEANVAQFQVPYLSNITYDLI